MTQLSILKFREYNGNEIISGISQGQLTGTHIYSISANDWNGRGASDRVDMLAPFDCIVKAVARYDNAVFFESIYPIKTPSGVYEKCWFQVAHMGDADFNKLGIKVGKTFKQGDVCYTENSKGIGSGDHIHMQQGCGKFDSRYTTPYHLTTKYYYYNGKKYAYYEPSYFGKELSATDFFFIEKGIEIVVGQSDVAKRYEWTYLEEGEFVGYKRKTYNGQTINLYIQGENEKLGIISAGTSTARKTIDKLDDERIHMAKVNGGYFDMTTGQHYGVEISPTQNVELVPHNDNYYVVWQNKDGSIENCLSSNFWLTKDDVEWAMTPFAILYHNGDCQYITRAYTNKMGVRNTQTFLIQLQDYKAILGVCSGSLTPQDIVAFAKMTYGNDLRHVSLYDSGGSSQMIVSGNKVVYTGRAIANGFTMYLDKKVEDETMFYLKVEKGTYSKDGKRAIPTRETSTGAYDLNFPLFVGDKFACTGEPINYNNTPCYLIGEGRQKGRYIRFDKDDLKNGFFTFTTK